jgi:hypothetical protein
MAKKGAEKRIIKPMLCGLEQMPDGRRLRRLAERQGLKPDEYAKSVNARRKVASKNTTGAFYTALFNEMYREAILDGASMPLFRDSATGDYVEPGFRPDSRVNGDSKNTYVEVKAISVKSGMPFFGYSQIANGIAASLEDEGAEIMTGIFRHGPGYVNSHLEKCRKKELGKHICDNRCLVSTLCCNTNDLLIVPHNLLTFILSISKSWRLNQTRSNSARDYEYYKLPYGTWITMLHENCEHPYSAVQEIFGFKTRKEKVSPTGRASLLSADVEGGFRFEDFHLRDLKARQLKPEVNEDGTVVYIETESSEELPVEDLKPKVVPVKRIYCRSARGIPIYRIQPFTITEYKMPDNKKWVETMRNKLDPLIELLGIEEQYNRVKERRAIQKADTTRVPVAEDDIPI